MCTKRLIVYFFISLCPILSDGQSQNIDSLKSAIEILANDSLKVKAWNDLSLSLWDSQPDMAIEFGEKSRDLASSLNDAKGVAYALKTIGMGYYSKGDYMQVLDYWQQSLSVMDSINDRTGVSNILLNIGSVYINQGDDAKAIDFYLRSLRVAEEINNKLRIASAFLGLGNVYLNKTETHNKALDYFSNALKLMEALDEHEAIGNASVNIGEIYYLQGKYDSALHYFEKSLEVSEIDGITNVPYSLNNIGKVYSEKGQYELAIDYHKKAYETSLGINDNLQMAQSLFGLANTYRAMNQYKQSIDPYLEAKNIAKTIGALKELQEIYEGLSASYAQLNEFTKAFQYQSLLTTINYELYNAANDKKLERLQFAYDIDKKQAEIESLTKDKLLQEANMKREKLVKNAYLSGFIIIILIAIIIYRNYKTKVKTNLLLDKQNKEIETLLLNILPAETAKELQNDGYATPRYYDSVSVLFTDFKGFTKIAEGLKPHELIAELNSFFNAFDDIVDKFHLEKIKTIGDSYMCAGGIPVENDTHSTRIVQAGLEMQAIMKQKNELRIKQSKQPWELRVGIHTGPIVAGVVGRKKYAYDIWGDTVNIASRMESNGEVGKVNISAATYELVKNDFECAYRGKIDAKNKGFIDMYFLEKELILA